MNLTVNSSRKLIGHIHLPASKSYSIRAFIIAALGGKSEIINPSNCDDALISINAARYLGASIKKINKNIFKVTRLKNFKPSKKINVGESGTTLRFLLPLLSLYNQNIVIHGKGTLVGRPNMHLNQTLRKMGVLIRGKGRTESVPIVIEKGNIRGGKIIIDGTLSSQFISALLIMCPQLKENSVVYLKGRKLVSLDYIVMTLQVLKKSGISIVKKGNRQFRIKGNQKFKGLQKFQIPSDYGLAAFHMAAAALIPSNLTLSGYFNDSFIQADGQFLKLLRQMGARFTKSSQSIKIKGPFHLRGKTFSLKDAPDLVPIVTVLALFAKGTTRIKDIAHARLKESDRISDLRKELLKIGAKIEETNDQLVIYPQDNYKGNVQLDSHHDHRLAMAFAVLGLKIKTRVKSFECVSKSYPDFVRDFKSIGVKV